MTEQVANTEGGSGPAQGSPGQDSIAAGPEVIKLPPGGPPKRRKKKRVDPRQNDRKPMMSFKDGDGTKPPKARKRPADQGRARPDGTPSRREASRRAMLEWLPSASHPADPVTVHLRTEYTKRLFLDHFGRAQISLYNLVCLLPIKMREAGISVEKRDAFTDLLEIKLGDKLDDLESRLRKDIARSEHMLNNAGASAVSRYSGEGDLEATLGSLTPSIVSLLNLLPLLDTFISCVDGLWINRFLRNRQREETINNYRNEIAQLIRHYMHMYHESKRLLGDGTGNEMATVFIDAERDKLSPEDEELATSILKVSDVKPKEAVAA